MDCLYFIFMLALQYLLAIDQYARFFIILDFYTLTIRKAAVKTHLSHIYRREVNTFWRQVAHIIRVAMNDIIIISIFFSKVFNSVCNI